MLTDRERFRLLGKYRTPRFRYGQRVECAVRGVVEIVGLTDGPIPWPIGRPVNGPRRVRGIILYDALAEAVRRESSQAVEHWWGVASCTVWLWRKALDVPRENEGTVKLLQAHGREPERLAIMAEVAREHGQSPERCEKIAAAKRGKPRPRHVIEAMRQGNLGRTPTDKTRARTSAAHKARGTRPPAAGAPWTAEEDDLVRTLQTREVAERTGRTLKAVYDRRRTLGLTKGRRRR